LPPFRKIITSWLAGLAPSATAASKARVQSMRLAAYTEAIPSAPARRKSRRSIPRARGTPSGKPAIASAEIGMASTGSRPVTRLSDRAQSAQWMAAAAAASGSGRPAARVSSSITSPVRRGRRA
jgi:hypothetical protein